MQIQQSAANCSTGSSNYANQQHWPTFNQDSVIFPRRRRFRGNRAGKKVRERYRYISTIISLDRIVSSKPTSRGVNLSNLTYIRPDSNSRISTIKLATWNAQSVNNKPASVCDLVISKQLDILTVTESWISNDNNTIAEILNTLKDFEYYNAPRMNRAGRWCWRFSPKRLQSPAEQDFTILINGIYRS